MGSVVEFLIHQFYVQSFAEVTNKMFLKSLTYAMQIARHSGNKKEQQKLKYIYENTAEWVQVPLPIFEDWYENARLRIKPKKMKPYSYGNKEFKLHEIITALSDAFLEINATVTDIAKRINIELEFDLSKYGNIIKWKKSFWY